jgi:hypothetical protein
MFCENIGCSVATFWKYTMSMPLGDDSWIAVYGIIPLNEVDVKFKDGVANWSVPLLIFIEEHRITLPFILPETSNVWLGLLEPIPTLPLL